MNELWRYVSICGGLVWVFSIAGAVLVKLKRQSKPKVFERKPLR